MYRSGYLASLQFRDPCAQIPNPAVNLKPIFLQVSAQYGHVLNSSQRIVALLGSLLTTMPVWR